MTIALLCRLPYAALHHVRLIEAESKTVGLGENGPNFDVQLPANWPRQSLFADMVLQEFAAGIVAFLLLRELLEWAYSISHPTEVQGENRATPFMFAVQHTGELCPQT